jgi:MoaA/NifB/PqqE/SkfB family radical SAM enzyme
MAEETFWELREHRTKALTFTGGGEPTTNPRFVLIAGLAHEYGLKLGLYTNGIMIDQLLTISHAFTWIYVSLDASNRSDYRQDKGLDMFDKVCSNITRLVAAKINGKPTVGAGFLVTEDNWEQAANMALLASRLGADYCQFRPVVGLDNYQWVPEALHLLDALAGPNVYVSRDRFLDLFGNVGRPYSICRASALVPCIGADGTVWVCPNTRGLRPLGSLKRQTFQEIWLKRPVQMVGEDCRTQCRNHAMNETLQYVCSVNDHDAFI